MPFKTAVMPHLDVLEPSAATIDAVNTIVNDAGVLTGSNTDVEAVATLLVERDVPRDAGVVIRGSGSMASAVAAAFARVGFERVLIQARNRAAGAAIAERHGFGVVDAVPVGTEVLTNVTPLGMTGTDETAMAFDERPVRAAALVLDVVASPAETPLIRAARSAGVPVVTGTEVHALQAALQFERYTGVRLTRDQVDRAREAARS